MAAAQQPSQPRRSPVVRCPSCGQDSVFAPSNPFRPFCTEVCKNIDLGAWASEQFRLEASPPDPTADTD